MGERGQLHGVEGVAAVPDVLVDVVHAGALAEKGNVLQSDKCFKGWAEKDRLREFPCKDQGMKI